MTHADACECRAYREEIAGREMLAKRPAWWRPQPGTKKALDVRYPVWASDKAKAS